MSIVLIVHLFTPIGVDTSTVVRPTPKPVLFYARESKGFQITVVKLLVKGEAFLNILIDSEREKVREIYAWTN